MLYFHLTVWNKISQNYRGAKNKWRRIKETEKDRLTKQENLNKPLIKDRKRWIACIFRQMRVACSPSSAINHLHLPRDCLEGLLKYAKNDMPVLQTSICKPSFPSFMPLGIMGIESVSSRSRRLCLNELTRHIYYGRYSGDSYFWCSINWPHAESDTFFFVSRRKARDTLKMTSVPRACLFTFALLSFPVLTTSHWWWVFF